MSRCCIYLTCSFFLPFDLYETNGDETGVYDAAHPCLKIFIWDGYGVFDWVHDVQKVNIKISFIINMSILYNIIVSLKKFYILIHMKKHIHKNVGTTDKIIRGVVAVGMFVSIGFVGSVALQWVLFVASALLLFTITTSWCGLYTLLKINTR